MNLKYTLTTILFCAASFVYAQQATDSIPARAKILKTRKIPDRPLCVNSRGYSYEEIKKLPPFANAATVKLVSYFKIHTVNNTDQIMSLIDEQGNYEAAKWQEEKTLNEDQIKKLGNILFNYGNKKVPYIREAVECFMPNNAILFYDKTGKISSVIEISFSCQNMLSFPSNLETGTWCAEKFDVMRKFFEDNKIKFYGTDQ